jgi:hypothetical protein
VELAIFCNASVSELLMAVVTHKALLVVFLPDFLPVWHMSACGDSCAYMIASQRGGGVR